ncbi:MAG: hypothetical protein VX246_16610 [Myxococcota bacterium]|nr:hypothetical protein [Myxococcota bacterium]
MAVHRGASWQAFADEVGVWVRTEGVGPRRVVRSESVEDLAYDASGGLWVGAMDGLWWIAPSELGAASAARGTGAEDRSPAPGAAARHVHRIATAGSWLAVAAEAGVFVSRGGDNWTRIGGAAPAGAASSVAIACDVEIRCDVWWLSGSAVWRAELDVATDALIELSGVREIAIAEAPAGVAPMDIVTGLPGLPVAVLYPHSIIALGATSGFRASRPVLPPGAEARRLGYALDRFWLATDRGLLVASDWTANWQRAGVPAGWLAVSDVASSESELFVATTSGLVRAGRVAGAAAVDKLPRRAASGPPTAAFDTTAALARLHRLALEHLSLDPLRQREWRQRADRRGWWPEVDVQIGYGGSRDLGFDEDQAYISGGHRQLYDRDRARADDWDASLSFTWDLTDAIFDAEVLDVAREERLWISLRDDVLDEINQLYFERRRVLLELASALDARSIEAARLRLRASELAAGLDAWTGGAFTASSAAFATSLDRDDALDRSSPRCTQPPAGSRTE